MAVKQSNGTETVDRITNAVQALGQAIVTLVQQTATRGERVAAVKAWQIPDAETLVSALVTLNVETDRDADDILTALAGVQYLRDRVAEQGVTLDLAGYVDAVQSAARPLAGMVDAADLLGQDVPGEVTTALHNAEQAIAAVGAASASKAKSQGQSATRGQVDQPWKEAGDSVRMVVTAPDGSRVSAQKASNLASVSSSTKKNYGETLQGLAGTSLVPFYAAAFAGTPTKVPTGLGDFTLHREG